MILHCDSCEGELGDYLYGKGGIEERAVIGRSFPHRLPDIVCNDCWKEGYSSENPKKKQYVINPLHSEV
jgi:hypothetical protein